jgi:hypothetical protein
MTIMLEALRKQPVSAIVEAIANIDHQIVISALRPLDGRPGKPSRATAAHAPVGTK